MGLLQTAITIILDCFYPRFCLSCGKNLIGKPGGAVYLCDSCAPNIDFNPQTCCSVCGKRLLSEKGICTRCRNRHYSFTRNISLFSYKDTAKVLLQSYKFEGYKSLAAWFADKLYIIITNEIGLLPVVPVPSRKKKKKKQGWDHIELIARKLSRYQGIEIIHLLARKGTKAQKTLTYEERLLNMKGSILPVRNVPVVPDEVILIDDVFTTGATAHECSIVLRQLGVKKIHVLTIALD